MKKDNILYISDLDGTLLNQSAKLSEYTINTLNSLITKGLNFSIATARLPEPAFKMMADVKLNIPIILMNGALIYDTDKKKYAKINRILPKNVETVIQSINDFDITGFMHELRGEEFITYHKTSKSKSTPNYIMDRIKRLNSKELNEGLSSISSDNIIYFTLIDSKERLEPIHDLLRDQPGLNQTLYKNIYNPDFWFLEIYSDKASKEKAVNYLKETYDFNQIVGFGDNNNDLPMFEACDIKVAVKNAIPEIKDIVNHICDTNENDGVVRWLEENVNIN